MLQRFTSNNSFRVWRDKLRNAYFDKKYDQELTHYSSDRWIPRTNASNAENVPICWRHYGMWRINGLAKRFSKQWQGWWFETPPCRLWRHRKALHFETGVNKLRPSQNDHHFIGGLFKRTPSVHQLRLRHHRGETRIETFNWKCFPWNISRYHKKNMSIIWIIIWW